MPGVAKSINGMMIMIRIMMNSFFGPAKTIVIDLHHRESSTRCEQDLKLRRI